MLHLLDEDGYGDGNGDGDGDEKAYVIEDPVDLLIKLAATKQLRRTK
jgi:hypothetical protein